MFKEKIKFQCLTLQCMARTSYKFPNVPPIDCTPTISSVSLQLDPCTKIKMGGGGGLCNHLVDYLDTSRICGNSTACVCYLNWKPVEPQQRDGPVGKAGLELQILNTLRLSVL